jgi:hypothetical protein
MTWWSVSEINESRVATFLDMDDVPHLTAAEKAKILRGVAPWELQARKSGVPGHGVGAIYPIAENIMTMPAFDIPKHWPRSYGMDPGWNCTAVIWFAWDTDHPYIDRNGERRFPAYGYDEYYHGQEHPAIHVASINRRGAWIPGVIDPAAEKARGLDGELLIDTYRGLGLNVSKADATTVSGLIQTWDMLSTQKLRIFDTLMYWRKEVRLYKRDEKGVVIKKNDHLMDATRYNVMSGYAVAKMPPASEGGLPWFTWSPELASPGGVWSG